MREREGERERETEMIRGGKERDDIGWEVSTKRVISCRVVMVLQPQHTQAGRQGDNVTSSLGNPATNTSLCSVATFSKLRKEAWMMQAR